MKIIKVLDQTLEECLAALRKNYKLTGWHLLAIAAAALAVGALIHKIVSICGNARFERKCGEAFGDDEDFFDHNHRHHGRGHDFSHGGFEGCCFDDDEDEE